MRNRFYSIADLFAGCGGLSLGFEQAGFRPVFVNELNKDALDTYLLNRHHEFDGEKFSNLKYLHSRNAEDFSLSDLNKLKHNLSGIKQINFSYKDKVGSSLDVVTGGPPCQGYSGIGHRRHYLVDKEKIPSNHLYDKMCFFIKTLRPRIFLFENVRGLLNAKWVQGGERKIWDDVLTAFKKIPGYQIKWDLIFVKDYGVPQNRPRVFIVGVRGDIVEKSHFLKKKYTLSSSAIEAGFFPASQVEPPPDLIDVLGDLVDEKIMKNLTTGKYPKGKFETKVYPKQPNKAQLKFRVTHGDKENTNQNLTDHEYSKHRLDIVEKFLWMLKSNGEIPKNKQTKKFSQRILKERWGNSRPNFTITSLPDDYVHFAQPRSLTVRECARIQTFPDWYQFCGKRTTGGLRRAGNPKEGIFERELPKYTQIGNAVPVKLAETIAKHFKMILDEVINEN